MITCLPMVHFKGHQDVTVIRIPSLCDSCLATLPDPQRMQFNVQASRFVFTMLWHSSCSPQIYSVYMALPLLHRQVAVQSYAPQTGAAASRSAAQFWLQVDFLTPSSRCLSACLSAAWSGSRDHT